MSESSGTLPLARRLFEQHGVVVQRYFRRLTADAAEAEDLTQEVFLRVVRNTDRYENRERERAWVFRIARNVMIDGRRRQSRSAVSDTRVEPVTPAVQATRASVRQALANLPPEEREAFLLREIGGLAYDEIGHITNSSVAAVRSRIYRARLALRDMLNPPAPLARSAVPRHDEHDS